MVVSRTISSKRMALRFSGHNKSLTYRTDHEDGEAIIQNISTTGCAITQNSSRLEVDDKMLLSITFLESGEEIQIQARVLRKEPDHLALNFMHMEAEDKQRLIILLARQNRSRTSGETSGS